MQIEPRPLDDPDVRVLIEEVQLEYVQRYGSPDHTALLPEEFASPRGRFLLGHAGGVPVAMGGWRAQDSTQDGLRDGDAEIKRMYVRATARRRGYARRILEAIERSAADAGRRRMVLETGSAQPEAVAMYVAAGYAAMSERYGLYADTESSLYFAKDLPPIRVATDRDLPVLAEIERAAGRLFAEIGMADVADDPPLGDDELLRYRNAGRCWVYVDDGGRPAAYLVAEVVDGALHLEQVSVHPEHAHRGFGRALIEHAAGHALDHGYPALTLTTFRDVPWNAPYYTRLGFRPLDDADLAPELRAVRDAETARGLDHHTRLAMQRDL